MSVSTESSEYQASSIENPHETQQGQGQGSSIAWRPPNQKTTANLNTPSTPSTSSLDVEAGTQADKDSAARDLKMAMLTALKRGNKRFCSHCVKFKPERTHHCRQCGKCVLKMDHHCPWISNCVGFNNYKFFMNLIIHAGN